MARTIRTSTNNPATNRGHARGPMVPIADTRIVPAVEDLSGGLYAIDGYPEPAAAIVCGAQAAGVAAAPAVTTYRLFPAPFSLPATDGDTASVNLAVEFYVTSAATATHISFQQCNNYAVNESHTLMAREVGLWDMVAGAFVATGTGAALTAADDGTWVNIPLSTPVALVVNRHYKAIVRHPGGCYVATSLYFSTGAGSAGITNGLLVAPNAASAGSAGQGTYFYSGSLSNTNASFNSTNYYADVIVSVSAGGTSATAGPASESDAAQPLARTSTRALGVATEAEAAQPLALRRTRYATVNPASEPDTAVTLGRVSVRLAGIALEPDAAVTLGRVSLRALGITTEPSAAQPLARLRVRLVGIVAEADTGQPFAKAASKPLGVALSPEAAQPVARPGAILRALGQALETALAMPLAKAARKAAGIALEPDTAQLFTLTRTRYRTVNPATETGAGMALARRHTRALGITTETDTATGIGRGTRVVLAGVAGEADTALPLARTSRRTLGPAGTVSTAHPFGRSARRGLTPADETDTAGRYRNSAGPISYDVPRPGAGTVTRPASPAVIRPGPGTVVRPREVYDPA